MRKCVIITNKQFTRTDQELFALWVDYVRSMYGDPMNSMFDINPGIDSHERRKFYESNRTYCEKERTHGLFHQWGSESTDDDNGVHEYTVGIVELADGRITTPLAQYIQFLPPDAECEAFEEFKYLGHHNIGRGFQVG